MCCVSGVVQVAADGGGGGHSQHMRNLDWEFAVVESPEINAFVVPGGKVVVYTGESGCVCSGTVMGY
jgi:predicted Zn-dependent protease